MKTYRSGMFITVPERFRFFEISQLLYLEIRKSITKQQTSPKPKTSMKKLLFPFFPFLFLHGSAQTNIEIRAGLNIASTKNLIAFPKNRLGWYGGVACSYFLSGKFALQPELAYSSKGYRYIDFSDGETIAMRLQYLSVPLLVKYRIDRKTSALIGSEFSYLLKATNRFSHSNFDASSSFPKKLDVGLCFGLQYNLLEPFVVETRYIYGFNSFYQVDEAGVRRSEASAANRVFQIGLRYRWKMKK